MVSEIFFKEYMEICQTPWCAMALMRSYTCESTSSPVQFESRCYTSLTLCVANTESAVSGYRCDSYPRDKTHSVLLTEGLILLSLSSLSPLLSEMYGDYLNREIWKKLTILQQGLCLRTKPNQTKVVEEKRLKIS